MPPGVQDMEKTAEAIRQKLHRQINNILTNGSWICRDCELPCERIESENGQPASCHRCGGHRIYFLDPLKKEVK
jgi:rubrerythrin